MLPDRIAHRLFVFLVVATSVAYIFAVSNASLTLFSSAMHDDGLFIARAKDLAQFHWLGAYNQMTLAKGPGYPLFLAFSSVLGIRHRSPARCSIAWLSVFSWRFAIVSFDLF